MHISIYLSISISIDLSISIYSMVPRWMPLAAAASCGRAATRLSGSLHTYIYSKDVFFYDTYTYIHTDTHISN